MRKIFIIGALLIFAIVAFSSGCNRKETFTPWKIAHWEKLLDGEIISFAFDPKDSNILYASKYEQKINVSEESPKTTLLKSEDGGAHWRNLNFEKDGLIDIIFIDPQESNNVWVRVSPSRVSSFHTVFLSDDGGANFKEVSNIPKDIEDKFLELEKAKDQLNWSPSVYKNPSNPNIMLRVGYNPFVERSEDGGKTWYNTLSPEMGGFLLIPKDPSIIYFVDAIQPKNYYAIIYESFDFGKTWERSSLPPLWMTSLSHFYIDNRNPNVIYAIGAGLFKAVEGKGTYEYYPCSNSLYTASIYIDPENSNSLYTVSLSYIPSLFDTFKSTDGGITWEHIGNFYYNPLSRTYLNYVVTPQPNPPYATGQLYASLDNGKSWVKSDIDLGKDYIWLTLPVSIKNSVYTENYYGLFRSNDNGIHWKNIANFGKFDWSNVDGSQCFNQTIYIDTNNPNKVYWSTYFATSNDGGNSWTRMNVPKFYYTFGSAIASDPHNPNVIYVGTIVTNPETGDQGEGIPREGNIEKGLEPYQGMLKSTDGGKTFEKIGLSSPYFRISAIAVSPTTGIVYAGTFYNGLFMSNDSGKSWKRIDLDSDPYISISSLTIDSKNGIVYVGVLGGGIFKVEDKN